MGWADLIGGGFGDFVASNRGKLGQLGAGLASGQNFSAGLANGVQGMPQGQATDDAYAASLKADAERAQQLNSTIEFMRQKGYNDLVGGVEGGGLDIGTAWGEALKRGQPGYGQSAPVKVGAGETLLDPNTYQPLYTGAPDPKDSFNQEKDLAAQYGQQDPKKTYDAVRNGYERVRASAELANKNPNEPGAADISMIFAYMKMLDPNSVVREGEFATAENAGGVGATVSNLYNKLVQGGRLTPEIRKQFLDAADSLYAESAQNLSSTNDQFTTRAQGWNVNPSNFITQPETYQPLSIGAGPIRMPNGNTIRQVQ